MDIFSNLLKNFPEFLVLGFNFKVPPLPIGSFGKRGEGRWFELEKEIGEVVAENYLYLFYRQIPSANWVFLIKEGEGVLQRFPVAGQMEFYVSICNIEEKNSIFITPVSDKFPIKGGNLFQISK